ncbi:hypothetical protein H0266_11555 [Halobacillus locisalis]|uniref:Uncharacterized protein n=1 Tax=Halobacillus locisalis TaxID=220753 RepID=A0A838CUP9_9BACI|nr:hypothetical protein [Halobacillus locisalis]MBA2175529.1 hypothetical protein [Halobacillus locisalis]
MAKKSKQYDYDLSEVKRLIGETDKNYREISAETGCPYASVVYHGRKIRGRVNRSHKYEAMEEKSPSPAANLHVPNQPQEQQGSPTASNGTTLSISRNDISIEDAEREAAKMIKAAQALGLSKINLTIEK